MSINSVSDLKKYRYNIESYLNELSAIVGREVGENELESLTLTHMIQVEAKEKFSGQETLFFEYSSEYVKSENFKKFIQSLIALNPSPVYVWTEKTNFCGALKVNSLLEINFESFELLNNDEIAVLLTSDLNDRLLVDPFEENGLKFMGIELQGNSWREVKS